MDSIYVAIDSNTLPYLPPEMITSILIRLPIKSLMRFQCVSKDWKNLFRTPFFIAQHLHHSTEQNSLLFGCTMPGCNLSLIKSNMQVLEFQKPHFIDSSSMGTYNIVSSCNGFLCVEPFNCESIFLWNPAIRNDHEVSKALKLFEDEYSCLGFGFSPIINDYKLVILFVSWYDSLTHRAEVYSLSTRLRKEVDVENLNGVNNITDDGVNSNGAIFWFGLTAEGESDRCLIVSFDIATEVFTLIKMPPTLSPKSSHHNKLIEYENKLAILSEKGCKESYSSSIDLWVKDGLSWTKIYAITSFPPILKPKTIWQNKIICSVRDMFRHFFKTKAELDVHECTEIQVNPMTNKFEVLGIIKRCIGVSTMSYVESLVPLGNNDV